MAIGTKQSQAEKLQGAQIKFTRKMLQSSHQWEVADLIKAGLNPVLSAQGHTGTVGVSAGGGPTALQESIGEVGSILDTAKAGARTGPEIDLLKSNAEAMKSSAFKDWKTAQREHAERSLLDEKGQTEIWNRNAIKADARLKLAEASRLDVARQLDEARLPGARFEALMDAGFYGKATRAINRGLPAANTALGTVGGALGWKAIQSRLRKAAGTARQSGARRSTQ